jgi:WD40 repeat protein
MPTITCTHCSQNISVDGPLPLVCPSCGKTLRIEGDVTRTGPPLPSTILQLPEPRRSTYGRYIVLKSLGSGGFGSVFQARDPELDVLVAIKVPRRDTGMTPQALDRFTREGRSAAQLRHEGIVSVLNVGKDGDLPYLVCEYVEGETLADRLREGPIDFREGAQIVAQLAVALEYAHSKGVIHRDLKPSNIMLCPGGKPRLMDFGLAKREGDATITGEHAVIGTPAFMSPEQAWGGKRHPVNRPSDVYSLGAVLYNVLTGDIPFHGEPRMVRRQVIEDEPKAPRALKGDIPRDLEVICQKAMRKEPDKRYASAGALAKDLERWLARIPIEARPVTKLEHTMSWCRRNPTTAGLVGTVAGLLMIGAFGATAMFAMERQHRITLEEALAKNREMLSHAYIEKGSRHLRAPQLSDDYNPLKALPWLSEAMKLDAENPERLLADRIRLQTQLDLAPRLERMWFFDRDERMRFFDGEDRASGLSPKRDTFFLAGANGTVNIWRVAEDGPPIASFVHPGTVAAAYSPDGQRLATCCQDGLRIWEIKSGKLLKGPLVSQVPHAETRVAPSLPGKLIAFDESGHYLFAAMREGLSQIWDSQSGEAIGPPIVGQIVSGDFADSGRLVVLFGGDRSIHVHDARTGAEKYLLRAEKHTASGRREIYLRAIVSTDGAKIASPCVSGEVVLWNAPTGKRIAQLAAPESSGLISAVAFSPDARLLATATLDGTTRLWRLADGALLWRQNVISERIGRLRFSPDGLALAVMDFEKRICTLASDTGAVISPPICNDSPLKFAEWIDSAGRILTIDVDGVGRLWNLDNQLPVLRLPHTNEIQRATISADRRVLATAEGAGTVCVLNLPANVRPDADGLKLIPVGDMKVDAITLNADGSQLAISDKGQVSIWDTHDARKRVGPLLHADAVNLMRFTPDGAVLVCASVGGRATAWDVAAGRRLYEPLDVSNLPMDIDIDHDGKRCAVAAVQGVTIWDLKTGIRVRPGFFTDQTSSFARFANDPRLVLVDSRPTGRLNVWDVAGGQTVCTLSSRRDLQSLSLSDDKRFCLLGYQDATGRLLSSADGTIASPAFDFPSTVQAATIDQTGRWVAVVAQDLGISLWDARTGELLTIVRPRDLEPTQSQRGRASWLIPLVFFSAENRYVHIVASNGLVASIELDPTNDPRKQIAEESAFFSGAEFDGAGGLRLLDPSELAARWQARGRQVDSQRAGNNQTAPNRASQGRSGLSQHVGSS